MNNWIDDITFFTSKRFKKISDHLVDEQRSGKLILPERDAILKAFALTPPDQVKVIILGQDPYPTIGHAMGLAFSVQPDVKPLPKSLQNIFKELHDDVGVQRTNGDLTDWAQQGVLLLNTSLTVVAGAPQSHATIGWGALTNEVIQYLNDNYTNLVFILWGKHAQQKGIYVDAQKHLIIQSPHPSPLSAHRGFFGSKCFSQTDKYLIDHGKVPIDW